MSHGLRFEVKTPTESLTDFRKRINQAAREEESGESYSGDSADWLLWPKLRSLGSVHHDRWYGNAAELAEREFIGVYPVIGWWRERHQLGKWNQQARYSLVVTIKTPEAAVDIYTSVENMISTVVTCIRQLKIATCLMFAQLILKWGRCLHHCCCLLAQDLAVGFRGYSPPFGNQ